LLCDEVGMGKTFVATAVARHYPRRLVVAPAALSQMWKQALSTTEIDADFVSFEKLSRLRSSARARYDLLIIDEAHHIRNQATRRYARLEELSRSAKLLLLTATPIHNRRDDLTTLLSLVLGSRADALTEAELARCVVRREHEQLKRTGLIPSVHPTVTLQISDDPQVVRELMMLPDPVPVRDGGLGRTLIARSLVHQWASSEVALKEAVVRRIARAYALMTSLETGHYPTETELRTWIFEEGALQLGFPELLSAPIQDSATLLESVRVHSNALERFHKSYSPRCSLDAERVETIAGIRSAHPKAKIVAFAHYTGTVSMHFRSLAHLGGVAMLTAYGARVAGGKLSRTEALSRFAPQALNVQPPSSSEHIDLLLATDLLSEGVNLQDAEAVVHLDIPWTAARLEQRVGRVARMGCPHSAVSVYMIRPPASAAALLENEILVQRKWDIARDAVGSIGIAPFPEQFFFEGRAGGESAASRTEKLRGILDCWRRPMTLADGDELPVASVSSPRSGFIAVVSLDAGPGLVVGLDGRVSSDLDSMVVACQSGIGKEGNCSARDYEAALQQLRHWADRESASRLAGLAGSSSLRRRRLVNRIDKAIEGAPPHARSQRLRTAAKARRVAAAQHSAAIEAELEALSRAPLSDEEYLGALALLDSPRGDFGKAPPVKERPLVHALLLLRDG